MGFFGAITLSHLFQRQRRRFRQRAALGDLATQAALLLLVLSDCGVVHHGQMWSLASVQTRENVLEWKQAEKGRKCEIGRAHV